MKRKKKSLVGWTLKKPFLKGNGEWVYFDDGKNLMPICYRKGFEKGIDLKMFKKVRITIDWIKKHNPCLEALVWWDKKERNPIKILQALIKDKKYDWANWFIVRVMEYQDYVSYAVFAAEQTLSIYEKKYPDDKRPREAIEAARKCIENPSEKNKAAAAADAAAYAAAAAYADAAADAAKNRTKMQLKILKYGMGLLEEIK